MVGMMMVVRRFRSLGAEHHAHEGHEGSGNPLKNCGRRDDRARVTGRQRQHRAVDQALKSTYLAVWRPDALSIREARMWDSYHWLADLMKRRPVSVNNREQQTKHRRSRGCACLSV